MVVLWIVIPAGWVLAVGLIGTQIDPSISLPATVALFFAFFIGLPLTWWGWLRVILRLRAGPGTAPPPIALRGAQPLRSRSANAYAEAPPPRDLPRSHRAAAALLGGTMFVGSLATWTALPLAWLWFASQLTQSTAPALLPYLVVLVGMASSMIAAIAGLVRLDRVYAAVTRSVITRPTSRATWLRSLRDGRPSIRREGILDRLMIASVIVAMISFGVWFLFFADASSLFQTYMD